MITRTIEEALKANDGGGTIGYHSIRFDEDGGTSFVQYGFNGEVLSLTKRTLPPQPRRYTFLERLFMGP